MKYSRILSLILAAGLLVLSAGCEEKTSISCIEWTPDGTGVVYGLEGKIYYYRVGGKDFAAPIVDKGFVEDRLSISPDGRFVYFTGNMGGSFDIWQAEIETKKLERLTEAPEKECSPVILPGGKKVVYLKYNGDESDLRELDLETKEKRQLTDTPEAEMLPAASPDGTLVACASASGDGERNLQVVDLGTGESTVMIGGYDSITSIRFSPDGKYIGFAADGKIHAILTSYKELRGLDYLAKIAGLKKAYVVAAEGDDFDWGGDSDSIVFSDSGGDIHRKKLSSSAKNQPLLASAGRDDLPRTSSDKKYIALSTGILPEEGENPVSATLLVLSSNKKKYHWGSDNLTTIISWCESEGRYEDALRVLSLLEKITRSEKDLQEVYRTKAEMLVKDGKFKEAAEIYEKYYQGEVVKPAEIYLYHIGDFEKAKALLATAGTYDEKAQRLAEQILPLNKNQLKLFVDAQNKLQEGNYNEAIKAREKFIKDYPREKASEYFTFEIGEILFKNMDNPRKALDAYRETLREYPDSVIVLHARENLVEIHKVQKQWQKAIDELDEILVLCADNDKRMEYVLEGLQIILFRIKDATRARKYAEQLFKFKPETQAARVPVEVVSLFDRSGNHGISNELLKLLIEGYGIDVQDIPGLIRSIDFINEDEFVRSRFDRIPSWFLDRVDILIEAAAESEERNNLKALKIFFLQRESMGLIEAWGKTRDVTKEMEEGLLENIRAGVFYSIANMAQNEGNIDRALQYYSKLSLITNRYEMYRTFENCISHLTEEDGGETWKVRTVFLEFLNNERLRRVAFWGDASKFYAFLSGEAESHPEKFDSPVSKSIIDETNAFYQKILSNKSAGPIVDNAYYRIISSGGDSGWQLYSDRRGSSAGIIDPRAVRKYTDFLSLYPEAEFYSRALDELMDELEKSGNYLLALSTIEKLRDSIRNNESSSAEAKSHLPELLLRYADISGEKLLLRDKAAEAYRTIVSDYPQSAQWEKAAQSLALFYDAASDYEREIKLLEELIDKRPACEYVTGGEALLALARAYDKNKDWESAERHYLEFLNEYREHPAVQDGTLLLEIFDKLSESAIKEIHKNHPDAILSAIPEMNAEEKERLFRIIPEIRDDNIHD